MAPKLSLKRKAAPKLNTGQRNPKRNKIQESRNILAQSSQKIVNQNGELDVGSFVKSREFEIKALEQGIKSSKHGLSTRAFQEVPRQLRRRTASHNVKKIPKRLRARAAKEIREDKTPTGSARKKDLTSKQRIQRAVAETAARKGAKAKEHREALAKAQSREETSDGQHQIPAGATTILRAGKEAPSSFQPVRATQPKRDALIEAIRPVSKFRKRQKDKTWLPTHLFHAKRAQMTPPFEPLWRFAIPLSPSEKCYRTTHRSATLRGCIAWDASYMSTILLEGVEQSLVGIFKRMGVPQEYTNGTKGQRWRQGSRTWQGWLTEARGHRRWIASTVIIWCCEEDSSLRNLDDETEPEPKAAKRSVLLRIHPAGFLQLWIELLAVAKEQRPAVTMEDLRFDIGSIEVEGPQAAEALAGIFHELPRQRLAGPTLSGLDWPTFARIGSAALPSGVLSHLLLMDPRLRFPPRPVTSSDVSEYQLLGLQKSWPGDEKASAGPLFDRNTRYASCALQASQKAINGRKRDAPPGQFPSTEASDPRIPAVLYATHHRQTKQQQNSWTILLPWNWVLPLWSSLMYYPLSSGGNPRFGGLDERRQLSFEQGEPWFPADRPGTQAGWNWELREQDTRRISWEKRPKGRRVEYSTVDLGNGTKGEIGRGWACDWTYLFGIKETEQPGEDDKEAELDRVSKENKKSVQFGKQAMLPDGVNQIMASQLAAAVFEPTERSILTVNLRLLHRGVPTICARIYRLPVNDKSLRNQWVALADVKSGRSHIRIQHKTQAREDGQADDAPQYPCVPGEEDLIGFVTTGNFNLGEGQGTGIGCIALAKVWPDIGLDLRERTSGLCIVREAGTSVGRLAKWTAV